MKWEQTDLKQNGTKFSIYTSGTSFVVKRGGDEVAAGDFYDDPLARAKFIIERDFCKQLPADERPDRTLGECRVIDNRERGLRSRQSKSHRRPEKSSGGVRDDAWNEITAQTFG